MRKKIGIIGYWFATNYGGVASYYSLCHNINNWGYQTFLVENPYYYTDKEGEDVFSRNFFKESGFEICRPYDIANLDKLNTEADVFILGSDQVITSSSIRAFGKLFLMGFSDDEKKRIAVSASFGGDNLDGKEELIAHAKKQLQRFSDISIREFAGIKIFKEKFRLKADFLIDPIFLSNAEQYISIGKNSGLDTEESYILAYILDPTPDKREAILKLSSMLNLDIKIALDGRKFTHEKNLKLMDLYDKTLPELDFKQWLFYYSNASYVITDSFHGAAMALILNKPFIIYANYQRGFPRFQTLIDLFDIRRRLVDSSKGITKELVNDQINFIKINNLISKYQAEAKTWIINALEREKREISSIQLPRNTVNNMLDIKKCMGCGACASICPKDAIELKYDEWGYYRSYVNEDMCIDCGKCAKICPALTLPEKKNNIVPECYEFIASDEKILANSSSGGFFPVLAKEVLRKNGQVAGAAWTNDFSVEHIVIDNDADLLKLQRSKYLQSYTGKIFRKIKTLLEDKIDVLFTGCPCQVAGLKAYLGQDYKNLLTIDLLCGNAPSSLFFKKYLKESFPEGIKKYDFRSKAQGYNAECIEIEKTNGEILVLRGIKEDAYQRVYHNHTMCPPHCENCQYQKLPRYGDLTIGDFWGLSSKDKTIDVRNGVSVVLGNTQKGLQVLKSIPEKEYRIFRKVPLDWLGGNGYAIKGSHNYASAARDKFYDAVQKMDFSKAVNYALKPNHGEYNPLYEHVASPLMLDSALTRFTFDPNVWEEHTIEGKITLHVKENQWKMYRYATLPLARPLVQGKRYIFTIRFKIRSEYTQINFHVKDSGTGCIQIIYSFKIPEDNHGKKWFEISSEFVADTDLYDQFMVGASQVSGQDNYLMFDYVNITEV